MAVFGVFFALDWGERPVLFFATIALGAVGFVAVGTLFGAVSSGTAIGQTLLPVLLFPLLTPVVIYGTSATGRLLVGRPWSEVEGGVRVLGAFALISLVAGATLFRYVVED
jgi:heme exporter protein B